MDWVPWLPALAFAAGGLFNAVVAYVSASRLAAEAERQDIEREQRTAATAVEDRSAAAVLEGIRESLELYSKNLTWAFAIRAGETEMATAAYVEEDDFPYASLGLIGSAEAVLAYLDMMVELVAGDKAQPLSDADVGRYIEVRELIRSALRAQAERARRREPLERLAPDDDVRIFGAQARLERLERLSAVSRRNTAP